MTLADLVDQPTLVAELAAMGLTPAEVLLLPEMAPKASRAVRDYCGRDFTRGTYDELYAVGPGEDLILNQWPVNAIARVASGPTLALSITNVNPVANQRAVVALAAAGDVDRGLIASGVSLVTWASGVTTTVIVPFAGNLTVAALAAAISAAGSGWSATATAPYALWPAADLRAPDGPRDALNGAQASFLIHAQDLGFILDAPSGIVAFTVGNDDVWNSARWGPALSVSYADDRVTGRPGGVRVTYDAGFDTIPGPVIDATVEVVKARIERLRIDFTISSESVKDYAYTTRERLPWLTDAARELLHPYRRIVC
jgi:hypothetical protein